MMSEKISEGPSKMQNRDPVASMLEMLLTKYGLKPGGVVLVGGNRSFSPGCLVRSGFAKIVVIEETPALLPALAVRTMECESVRLVHAAVSRKGGSTTRMEAHREEGFVAEASLEEVFEVNRWPVESHQTLVARGCSSYLDLLEGAGNMLRHLELALFEYPLEREEQGRMELEGLLTAHGLACAGDEMDASGETRWVSYVRRPVVTMSTLGRNGRFANQLFQYLFLRLVAEKQKAVLQLPAWKGEELFGFQSVRLLAAPGRLAMESHHAAVPGAVSLDRPIQLMEQADPGFLSTDFWGYYQMHTATLRPYRERIGTLFSWGERYQRVGEQVLERLRAGGRRVVAVHLRRGDYGYDAFFRAPCAWYERWVRSEGLDPERHVIFLCSEEAARYAHRFPGHTVASSSLFAGELGVEEWLLDFLLLCSSDVLAISNSTFSFFASLLNNNATSFARPVAETEGLVKFDPWDAHPLLGTKLSRETHLRLAEQD